MKLKIQTKLFLGFISIMLATVIIVTFTSHYLITKQVHMLFEDENFMQFGVIAVEEPENPFLKTIKEYLGLTAIIGSLLAIIASFILSKYIVDPINKVIETTKKIAKGQYQDRIEDIHHDDELGELCKSVNTMAEGLEETEKLRRELISNMAHELATPLTNIGGYLEAMRDGTIKGEELTHNTLKMLKNETDRLGLMVNDLRSLSHIENPHIQLKPKHYDLQKLLEEITAKIKPEYEKKKINLTIKTTPKSPKIFVDKDKFSQIIINLLNNAIAATKESGSIVIYSSRIKNTINVTVEDTGTGISEKDLNRIFERFYRADKSRSRKTGGTGIGLSIVKALMEAHGGTVTVESKPSQGSKFTCSFPIK